MNAEENVNLDWNKIVRDNKKAGFRDGVSAGREENFQGYSDEGYKEGFKNGFLMGKYKGILKTKSLINKQPVEEENLLKDSRKGFCVMCKDNSLLESTIEEIRSKQEQDSNLFINSLQKKYNLNK